MPTRLCDIPYKSAHATPYEIERCRLDLCLPDASSSTHAAAPALLWFHGGGLTGGDKVGPAEADLMQRLASAGIASAMATYRFSPQARYPDYVLDAAAAFVWLRDRAHEHGIDPARIFVGGHSAGAYLAALIGLDPSHLRAVGGDPSAIRGLIPVSAQVMTHFTVRQERGVPLWQTRPVIDDAAPCYHARADAPPMLLICGGNDIPTRPEENRYIASLMRHLGHPDFTYLEVPGRDHGTIVGSIMTSADPVATAMVRFIQLH